MRAIVILSMVLSVSVASKAAAPATRTALVGNWEEDPGTCAGDNNVAYRPDGTFFGYDYEGRWSLVGDSLTTIVTRRMNDDERWRRVKPPEPSTTTIVTLSSDRLEERWADGSLHQQHRCR